MLTDIGRGSLTNFYIDDGGSGYEIGDDINFDNTDTGGGSARAKVSVVNGGFTQEDFWIKYEEDHIILEDETVKEVTLTQVIKLYKKVEQVQAI